MTDEAHHTTHNERRRTKPIAIGYLSDSGDLKQIDLNTHLNMLIF